MKDSGSMVSLKNMFRLITEYAIFDCSVKRKNYSSSTLSCHDHLLRSVDSLEFECDSVQGNELDSS